jgi:hypothetical protein
MVRWEGWSGEGTSPPPSTEGLDGEPNWGTVARHCQSRSFTQFVFPRWPEGAGGGGRQVQHQVGTLPQRVRIDDQAYATTPYLLSGGSARAGYNLTFRHHLPPWLWSELHHSRCHP